MLPFRPRHETLRQVPRGGLLVKEVVEPLRVGWSSGKDLDRPTNNSTVQMNPRLFYVHEVRDYWFVLRRSQS